MSSGKIVQRDIIRQKQLIVQIKNKNVRLYFLLLNKALFILQRVKDLCLNISYIFSGFNGDLIYLLVQNRIHISNAQKNTQ